MSRIIAEVKDGSLVVTRFESKEGFVIPDDIVQSKRAVSIIYKNLDADTEDSNGVVDDSKLAVSREEFLLKVLSISESCMERYSKFGKGLYSKSDMQRGITWAEVAYLLHYVVGLEESLDWNEIRPAKDDRVCVSHEIVYGKKRLDEKLASYKNRLDMERYISSIVSGKRYIPLPLYCSFIDLMNQDGLETELTLNMMFKKISKEEFKLLI